MTLNIKNTVNLLQFKKQTGPLADTLAGSIILQNSPHAINLLEPHQNWLDFSFQKKLKFACELEFNLIRQHESTDSEKRHVPAHRFPGS